MLTCACSRMQWLWLLSIITFPSSSLSHSHLPRHILPLSFHLHTPSLVVSPSYSLNDWLLCSAYEGHRMSLISTFLQKVWCGVCVWGVCVCGVCRYVVYGMVWVCMVCVCCVGMVCGYGVSVFGVCVWYGVSVYVVYIVYGMCVWYGVRVYVVYVLFGMSVYGMVWVYMLCILSIVCEYGMVWVYMLCMCVCCYSYRYGCTHCNLSGTLRTHSVLIHCNKWFWTG